MITGSSQKSEKLLMPSVTVTFRLSPPFFDCPLTGYPCQYLSRSRWAVARLLQAAPGVTFSAIQVNLVQEPGVSIDHAIMRSQVKHLAAVIPPILKNEPST
jgi:hypothetical protein